MYGQHEKHHREAQCSNPLKRQPTTRKQRQLLLLKKRRMPAKRQMPYKQPRL